MPHSQKHNQNVMWPHLYLLSCDHIWFYCHVTTVDSVQHQQKHFLAMCSGISMPNASAETFSLPWFYATPPETFSCQMLTVISMQHQQKHLALPFTRNIPIAIIQAKVVSILHHQKHFCCNMTRVTSVAHDQKYIFFQITRIIGTRPELPHDKKHYCCHYDQLFVCSMIRNIWAATWDFKQYVMGDQQRLRSACANVQSDQSIC